MKKCHHIYDKKTNQKVLIPMCWSVTISNDIEDCTCIVNKRIVNNPKPTEEDYKRTIRELNTRIENLNSIIKGLKEVINNR